MIPAALLDTDTLSHLMRQDRTARAQGLAYLAEHGQFTFSLVTRYEALRGLKVKQAAIQRFLGQAKRRGCRSFRHC
jgi:tRNA(fMet)-specific endonuclease VapC